MSRYKFLGVLRLITIKMLEVFFLKCIIPVFCQTTVELTL